MASVDFSNGDSISSLHPDIIQSQILTRLDGPTLASTASTSSYLQTLCTEQKLWREISTATWPSINDPCVAQAISSFPAGYRSFFADSYPLTEHTWEKQDPPPTGLISAVDLYYRGELIYSKVQEMATESGKSGWFLSSPFRVDMVDPKESIETRIRYPGGDYEAWVRDMEESMRLNWIVIDPMRKRAANISSRRAVSAKRNWLTGDLEIRFSTVVEREKKTAEVAAVVSCGSAEAWKEVDEEVGGEVHVRDVRLQVEDIEGKSLKGRDSLVILQGLLEGKRCKEGEERVAKGKGRYEEYVVAKTQWREKKERRERDQDTLCMIFGFSLFVLLWTFILLR